MVDSDLAELSVSVRILGILRRVSSSRSGPLEPANQKHGNTEDEKPNDRGAERHLFKLRVAERKDQQTASQRNDNRRCPSGHSINRRLYRLDERYHPHGSGRQAEESAEQNSRDDRGDCPASASNCGREEETRNDSRSVKAFARKRWQLHEVEIDAQPHPSTSS